jgi:hypothetical protein
MNYAAYSSILHQIFCHELIVASWSISEEKYLQKNQGTAGHLLKTLTTVHLPATASDKMVARVDLHKTQLKIPGSNPARV